MFDTVHRYGDQGQRRVLSRRSFGVVDVGCIQPCHVTSSMPRSRTGWLKELRNHTRDGVVEKQCPNCERWLVLEHTQWYDIHHKKKCIGQGPDAPVVDGGGDSEGSSDESECPSDAEGILVDSEVPAPYQVAGDDDMFEDVEVENLSDGDSQEFPIGLEEEFSSDDEGQSDGGSEASDTQSCAPPFVSEVTGMV
jgi:hypothetical protein